MKKLKFAPLVRVSTEQQAKRGDSLRTQTKNLIEDVKSLNGVIPKFAWKYSGQEHATGVEERKKLDQLLNDCDKNIFDCVIITDLSRWSRNNLKSEESVKIFKQNGIRFFVRTKEYSLFDPRDYSIIGLHSIIYQLQADEQTLKAIENKLARLKRGIPSSGWLPYGRTFNRDTGKWGIDKEKKKLINRIANQYLSGKSLKQLAENIDLNYPNLIKTLKERTGTEWTVNFNIPRFKIAERIVIKMPRLLTEEKIMAIHEKINANKTFTHGSIKNKYLFGRMIFCGHCGYALSGQVHNKNKYYRHRGKGCGFNSINALVIEDKILQHIFEMFGDPKIIEKAQTDAIPNLAEINRLEDDLKKLKTEIIEVGKKKNNLIEIIELSGNDPDVLERIKKHNVRIEFLRDEEEFIKSKLVSVPTKKEIKKKAQLLKRMIKGVSRSQFHLNKMNFTEKKEMLQSIFSGKDSEGRRLGIYLKRTSNKEKPWLYEIRGTFQTEAGRLPDKIKLNMVSLS